MRGNYVLDACALVALVKNESGANIVADVYEKSGKGKLQLFINRINLLECITVFIAIREGIML